MFVLGIGIVYFGPNAVKGFKISRNVGLDGRLFSSTASGTLFLLRRSHTVGEPSQGLANFEVEKDDVMRLWRAGKMGRPLPNLTTSEVAVAKGEGSSTEMRRFLVALPWLEGGDSVHFGSELV